MPVGDSPVSEKTGPWVANSDCQNRKSQGAASLIAIPSALLCKRRTWACRLCAVWGGRCAKEPALSERSEPNGHASLLPEVLSRLLYGFRTSVRRIHLLAQLRKVLNLVGRGIVDVRGADRSYVLAVALKFFHGHR
jgi:hypothetical protein